MRLFALSLALAAVASSAAAVPLPTRSIAQAQRASDAEALTFVQAYSPSELRRAAEIRMLRENFVSTLHKDPNTKAMLEAFPALGPELVKALESQIDLYMRDYDVRFFPEASQIAQREFTRDEILALTAFYHSGLGRKTLTLSSGRVDGAEIAQKALEGKTVDQDTAQRQLVQAGWAVLGGLTPDERTEFIAFLNSPLGQKFTEVQPKIAAVALRMMNPPSPAFEAASEKAMSSAFKRVTGIDLPKQK